MLRRSVTWFAPFLLVVACTPAESGPSSATLPAVAAAPLGARAPTTSRPPAAALVPIRIVEDRLELGTSPTFETGKDQLLPSPENDSYVATVVDYLTRHPEVTKLRIEVHTDGQGASEFDQRLSQDRADRLTGALVDRGIATDRLRPVGYGKTRPIAPNSTAEGRAANRRVELHVEEVSGAPLGNRAPP
jgi:outer membrane protein OmpA-like peptidoglycan-associated protein